jgi:FPC/CPF motif-containing protein YcgG
MGGLSPQQALSLYEAHNPFQSVSAYQTSNYSAYLDGQLVRLLDWREPGGQAKMVHRLLRSFLTNDSFSCVAGRAAALSGGDRFGFYETMEPGRTTHGLARDLAAFVAEMPFIRARYRTFVAVFNEPCFSEAAFERGLWRILQALHELDVQYFPWASNASKDPRDPRFAFSVAEHPFFLVGMHPAASRISRRFALPAIAFNSHDQFDALRASGHFTRIQRLVRDRELELQGTLNPNLADYGTVSEARQYAGQPRAKEWKCPFNPRS